MTGRFPQDKSHVTEGRTLVERIMESPPPRGAFKVILPVLFPTFIRPAVQKGMNMLKSVVEAAR